MSRKVLYVPDEVSSEDAAQHIRGECCRRGYKVVDYALDEYTERRYVVVEKIKKPVHKPKRRFF